MNVIENGYKIPWINAAGPPKDELPNNQSALLRPDFVEEQLSLLERIRCIRDFEEKPHKVMPLIAFFSNK
jgi:hypothetical protein